MSFYAFPGGEIVPYGGEATVRPQSASMVPNAGGTGASNSARDQNQFDNRSLWRDNVSSSSSNVQVRGGNEWIFFLNIPMQPHKI